MEVVFTGYLLNVTFYLINFFEFTSTLSKVVYYGLMVYYVLSFFTIVKFKKGPATTKGASYSSGSCPLTLVIIYTNKFNQYINNINRSFLNQKTGNCRFKISCRIHNYPLCVTLINVK